MLLAREVLLEQPSCSIPDSRGNSTLERKLVDNDMQDEAGALARSVGKEMKMKIKFDQQEVGKVESGGSRGFTRHTAQSSIQHQVLQLCYIAREREKKNAFPRDIISSREGAVPVSVQLTIVTNVSWFMYTHTGPTASIISRGVTSTNINGKVK